MIPGDAYCTPLTPDTDWLSDGGATDWGRLRAGAADLAMQLVSAGCREDVVLGRLDPETVSTQAPFGWLLWEFEVSRKWERKEAAGAMYDVLERWQLRLAPDGVIYEVIVDERKELGLPGTMHFSGESTPADDFTLKRSESTWGVWKPEVEMDTYKEWSVRVKDGSVVAGGLAGALRGLRIRLLEPLGAGTTDAKWF